MKFVSKEHFSYLPSKAAQQSLFNWHCFPPIFQFVVNRQALKGLLIAVALSCFNIATACFVIITYASHIIHMTGIEIDSLYGSLLFAGMQIAGNVCITQLTERVGRKFLLVISLLGSAIGLAIFSAYFYLVDMGYDLRAYQLVPLISISFVIFIGSAGVVALAGVCAVENLTPKVNRIIKFKAHALLSSVPFHFKFVFFLFYNVSHHFATW